MFVPVRIFPASARSLAGAFVALALLIALLIAPAASGQNNVIVVCDGCEAITVPTAQVFSDIDAAITFFNMNTGITEIQIHELGSPWTAGALPVFARTVTIEGVGDPQNVVLSAGGPSMIEIGAGGDVVLEGLTLQGAAGQNVIEAMAGEVVINQCFITDAGMHGVHVNGGTATIVNTAIVGNAVDGVHVAGGTANIQFSTIIRNGNDGVEVAGGTATVKNNIIAENAAVGINGSGGTVTNDWNDVWNNSSGTDFAGTVAGANDVSLDPFFLAGGDWEGQISNTPGSPVIDKAEPTPDAALAAFTIVDFDNDVRPTDILFELPDATGTEFDIGADEFPIAGSPPVVWTDADVSRDPTGAVLAGDFRIRLEIDHVVFPAVTDFNGVDTKVVLLPELEQTRTDVAIVADHADFTIPMEMSASDPLDPGGDGVWFGSNAVPIPSAEDQLALSPQGTVFDGRARIVVIVGGFEVQPLPGSEAVTGRFFTIDTVPPEIFGIPEPPDGVTADFFVRDDSLPPKPAHNDTFSTDVIPVSSDDGVPLFFTTGAQVSTTLIRKVPGGEGAKMFFNVGHHFEGAFGGTAGRNLEFTVQVTFVDESPNPAITSVGGFDPLMTGVHTIPLTELFQLGSTTMFPQMPRWKISGSDPFNNESNSVEVEFIPANFNATTGRPEMLTVIWRFANAPTSSTGNHALLFDQANGGYFNAMDPFSTDAVHWAIQFVPVDASGEAVADDPLDADDGPLDPLHIWWQLRPQTDVGPTMDQPVARPQFFWNLKRPDDPGDSGELDPQFAVRLLESVHADQGSDAAKAGPYQPVAITLPGWSNGWRFWNFEDQLTYNGFFEELTVAPNDLTNRWLAIVVLGVDEAGNVEMWPSDITQIWLNTADGLDGFDTGMGVDANGYVLTQGSGLNWERFFIDTQPEIETEVIANFWHNRTDSGQAADVDPGESSFGAARVIPLPPADVFDADTALEVVSAMVTVTLISDIGSLGADVTLTRADGTILGSELVGPPAGNTVTVFLSGVPGNTDRNDGIINGILGDRERKDSVNYVLRVMNVTTSGEADSTPVNYYFAVVPDVAEYIENRTSPDLQPIKTVETN